LATQAPTAPRKHLDRSGGAKRGACLSSIVAAGTPSLTGRRVPSARLEEMQRGKILCGAVHAFDELGYERATVTQIISRARVSRSSFYALFADRDECLAAILSAAAGSVARELAAAGVRDLPWSERVRAMLLAVLEFFDRERAVARVCVLESLRGSPRVLERRAQLLAQVAATLDEGRSEHPCDAHCTPLTAEGLVGAVFTIVHSRLLREQRDRPAPLVGLSGDLDAILLLPYLGDAPAPAPALRTQDASRATASTA
jgi:AcrR family transcriptional regulator